MAYRIEVRGPEVLGGGATPDEFYGVGEWGPAIYGTLNRSGMTNEEASTFSTAELARLGYLALLAFVVPMAPSLEFRIIEVP